MGNYPKKSVVRSKERKPDLLSQNDESNRNRKLGFRIASTWQSDRRVILRIRENKRSLGSTYDKSSSY